ncbi:MAG: alpha/beta fold hydrolase [Candidatus Promineifilaceae bacterium]|jgi:pimeloyl-ACP methyl ester carboxylesterase
MTIKTLPGIEAEIITSERITTRVLFSGPEEGIPVLFLHGNLSSATWWEEVMGTLPDGFRAIAPDQRGFGEAEFSKKIDATRGMGDLADDALALLDNLGYDKAHFVGNSLGGSVLWWVLKSAPARVLTATLVSPGSPYGFGGTRDIDGTPCYDDYAGCGAGIASIPEVVRLVREGYRGSENPMGTRMALRTLVYRPPFVPEREEDLLSAALTIHVGGQDWPGDFISSPNWPYFAPGVWGAANGLSSEYALDPEQLYSIEPKPDIFWIRGEEDKAVADGAASDPAVLGSLGLIPNYPGPDVYPPQPMIAQTRAVLDRYVNAGGTYKEIVIAETGHVPFIDKLDQFNEIFHAVIQGED